MNKAIHEAGHVCVARHFGFNVLEYSFDPPFTQLHLTHEEIAAFTPQEAKEYLHYVYAGHIAETKYLGKMAYGFNADVKEAKRIERKLGVKYSAEDHRENMKLVDSLWEQILKVAHGKDATK